VQDALGPVLFVVVAVAAVAAVWAIAGTGEAYRQIGHGGLSLRDGSDRPTREPGGAAANAEREAEIRQLLEARNARRAAKGLPPADVETELRRLLAPAADPALEAEIRQLVIARNARRARKGQAPLDIEAEVARRLAELS
jgi:hypothetical protein